MYEHTVSCLEFNKIYYIFIMQQLAMATEREWGDKKKNNLMEVHCLSVVNMKNA